MRHFFYTFRNQNDFYCLSAPQISNIFATFRYLNLCNRFCKLGKPVVRNRHGNFFRTVHLRMVIKWSRDLRYGIFLEVRITEHRTVTYRSKPLKSNDQSVPLHRAHDDGYLLYCLKWQWLKLSSSFWKFKAYDNLLVCLIYHFFHPSFFHKRNIRLFCNLQTHTLYLW